MLRKVAFCVALLISVSVPVAAQAPATSYSPSLLLGAAWYPEQWPESRWEADLSLMEAAHIHLVRIGEFAWSSLDEGDYQLDWLDHAVRAAERHHVALVIGTPTAGLLPGLPPSIQRLCAPWRTDAKIGSGPAVREISFSRDSQESRAEPVTVTCAPKLCRQVG